MRSSQSYKLVDGLNKRFLLLLSATPVQNELTELYNLLTLLKPGIFKTLKEFRAAYMIAGKPRQPANPERLRELMRGAMVRNTRAVVALTLPRRHATTIRVEGSEGERRAYGDLPRLYATSLQPVIGRDIVSHCITCSERGIVAGRCSRNGCSLRRAPHRRAGLASACASVVGFGRRRQGGGSDRTAAAQSRGKEAGLRPLPRDPESSRRFARREGIGFARFEGALSGPDKDAAIADFRDACRCCCAPNRAARDATFNSATL